MLIECTVYQLTTKEVAFVARGYMPAAPRVGDVLSIEVDKLPVYFRVHEAVWPVPNTKQAFVGEADGLPVSAPVGRCELYCRRFERFPLGDARTAMLFGDKINGEPQCPEQRAA